MTNLVNKDTYRHKNTEVWKMLGGNLGGKTFSLGGGQIPPMPPLVPPLDSKATTDPNPSGSKATTVSALDACSGQDGLMEVPGD